MKKNINKEYLKENYFNKNFSSTQIAKIFGLTRQGILYYFKKYGIEIKNPSDRVKGIHSGNFGKTGKLSSNYIHGKSLKEYYCSCGNRLSTYKTKLCKECYLKTLKGKGNPNFGKGEKIKGKNNFMFGKIAKHSKGIYYNNIWMRSSWELFFVKWCDKNKIKWLYESKTFDLGDTTYTPDFYLPEFNLYIEIKGFWRDDAKKKFEEFKQRYCGIRIKLLEKRDLKSEGILSK